MPDYSKSKIYKLTSSNSNEIYIGSTIQNLYYRKGHHIEDYKKYLLNKQHYITSFKIIERGGDIDICLLEEYPCDNKEQLHQRERFYIDSNICVNKVIPGRTKKEYNELNKDKKKEYAKEYYNLNKDIINKKSKEYNELNKDKFKELKRLNYELNKEKIKEERKLNYELNKEKIKEERKLYYELNKDKIKKVKRLNYKLKKEQHMI